MCLLSCVRFYVSTWTMARRAPLSTGFFRQECWSGFPFLSPGDPPQLGIEIASPALKSDCFLLEPSGKHSMESSYFRVIELAVLCFSQPIFMSSFLPSIWTNPLTVTLGDNTELVNLKKSWRPPHRCQGVRISVTHRSLQYIAPWWNMSLLEPNGICPLELSFLEKELL